MQKKIPVIVLSGFLGSGKTTLLSQIIGYCKDHRITPAVIINEIGDVNLDGLMLEEEIAMKELLSGCICCTSSGDLGLEIRELVTQTSPDVIVIEATGVANPLEIFDAVTDAAILTPLDLNEMISIVDATHFLDSYRKGKGKTYHLMLDQIRCASVLILNKSDLVHDEDLKEAKKILRTQNAQAVIHTTTYCDIPDIFYQQLFQEDKSISVPHEPIHSHDTHRDCSCNDEHGHHHSHNHITAFTHYFEDAVDTERFKHVMNTLPPTIYRAKGVFTTNDTGGRMLFQYAYRQLELLSIDPQGKIEDVATFIGEHLSKAEIIKKLKLC